MAACVPILAFVDEHFVLPLIFPVSEPFVLQLPYRIVFFRYQVFEMDPSAQELAAIGTLESAFVWIGMHEGVVAALRESMGDLQLVREVVLIPQGAWDAGVGAMRFKIAGEEGAPADRALSALELGQVASVRRVCRLRLGLPAAEGGGDGGSQASGGVVALVGAQAAPVVRKIKISQIFDQADDTEIVPWNPARARSVMAAFRAANDGEDPEEEEDVTADQLAALEHRLQSGACPCPDFGVWRPFGQRLARALKLTVHHCTPGGDYVPYEVQGPPSHAEWRAAYRVFAVGMRALGAATATRLNMYANRVSKFNDVYGQMCWWLVAQADQRMRSEHLERIRRTAEDERNTAVASGGTHPFDPLMPWDYCLKAAACDRRFWDEELDRKCVLFITHLRSQRQLTDDGHGAELRQHGGPAAPAGSSEGGGRGTRKRHRTGAGGSSGSQGGGPPCGSGGKSGGGRGTPQAGSKGKGTGKGKAHAPDGRYRTSETGAEICWTWNHHADGCSGVCANNRAHICEWCRSPQHRSIACSKKAPGWTPPQGGWSPATR